MVKITETFQIDFLAKIYIFYKIHYTFDSEGNMFAPFIAHFSCMHVLSMHRPGRSCVCLLN
jgi:hypothetical protein